MGIGYVGLPTAAMFASKGHRVVGYDVNEKAVNALNKGEIIIEELAPKNAGKVLFTLGGSDANEFAIRFAKAYTGRDKIFSKSELM